MPEGDGNGRSLDSGVAPSSPGSGGLSPTASAFVPGGAASFFSPSLRGVWGVTPAEAELAATKAELEKTQALLRLPILCGHLPNGCPVYKRISGVDDTGKHILLGAFYTEIQTDKGVKEVPVRLAESGVMEVSVRSGIDSSRRASQPPGSPERGGTGRSFSPASPGGWSQDSFHSHASSSGSPARAARVERPLFSPQRPQAPRERARSASANSVEGQQGWRGRARYHSLSETGHGGPRES